VEWVAHTKNAGEKKTHENKARKREGKVEIEKKR
jgi:hypothetical protein